MGAASNLITEPADRVLKITRVFDAPRTWCSRRGASPSISHDGGGRGIHLPVSEMDFRPGGAYRYHMRGPDNDDHWSRACFARSSRPSASSWSGAGRTLTAIHAPRNDADDAVRGCRRQDQAHAAQRIFESVASRDTHNSGWTARSILSPNTSRRCDERPLRGRISGEASMQHASSITPQSGDLLLMVGTVKGAFIFHSDRNRREFQIAGPYFKGQEVFSAAYLPDKKSPRMLHRVKESALGLARELVR